MKRFLFFVAVLTVVSGLSAAPVSRSQALLHAKAFAMQHGRTIDAVQASSRQRANADSAPYYVFNADKGFVVVSGDDRTPAILGYTDSGAFDEGTVPPALQYMLDSYEEEISMLDGAVAAGTAQQRTPVAPLLATNWDQWSGSLFIPTYNKMCPYLDVTDGRAYTLTGCVATALAQILRYHRWPEAETSSLPGYYTSSYALPVSSLDPVVFDWDNMPEVLTEQSSDAEIDAVSTLMRYCGQAVNMDYYFTVSNAFVEEHLPAALANYFGYDYNARCCRRASYGIDAWEDMIYAEVAAGRPVLYAGAALGGGHCFVCDGADADGLFHINWGWSGEKNGFFRLGILNPMGQGAGAASSTDGYAMQQVVVVGIQPPTGNPVAAPVATTTNTMLSGDKVVYTFTNASAMEVKFALGIGYVDSEDNVIPLFTRDIYQKLQPGGKYSNISFDLFRTLENGLADGVYHVVPIYRVSDDPDSQWTPCPEGPVYVEMTVFDNGTDFSARKCPDQEVVVNDIRFTGSRKAGEVQTIEAVFENRAGEISGQAYLFASLDDTKGFAKFRSGLFVREGDTETLTFEFLPTEPGIYNIWICTDESGKPSSVVGQTTVSIADEGDGIAIVATPPATGNHAFNLSGQRVKNAVRGVILVNGRKIVK